MMDALSLVHTLTFDAFGTGRASGYRGAYVNRYDLPYEETPYFFGLAAGLGCP